MDDIALYHDIFYTERGCYPLNLRNFEGIEEFSRQIWRSSRWKQIIVELDKCGIVCIAWKYIERDVKQDESKIIN